MQGLGFGGSVALPMPGLQKRVKDTAVLGTKPFVICTWVTLAWAFCGASRTSQVAHQPQYDPTTRAFDALYDY